MAQPYKLPGVIGIIDIGERKGGNALVYGGLHQASRGVGAKTERIPGFTVQVHQGGLVLLAGKVPAVIRVQLY